MTAPTREQAFEAFCVVLAYAMGQRAAASVYTQADLPPGVKSADAYKRRHRELCCGKFG